MTMMNKIERDGQIDRAKGKAKQAIGGLTGNRKLKDDGTIDEAVGKTKVAVGGVQKKAGAAIERAGKAVRS